MKTICTVFLSMVMLSISGCGGGGGSGKIPVPESRWTGTGLQVSGLAKDSGVSASFDGRSITFRANDFTDYAADPRFESASKTSQGRDASRPGVEWTATDTVIMGGKDLGLQYADFGIWDGRVDYTLNGGPVLGGLGASDSYYPLIADVDGRNKAAFSGGGGTQTFNGTTVAIAHGGGQVGTDILTGTATMTVNLANLGASTLGLSLTNFADFSVPVAINARGGISAKGNASVSNITTGRDLTGPISSTVNGQFYGSAANNPSEAVGSYLLQSNDQAYTSIVGSFGVK